MIEKALGRYPDIIIGEEHNPYLLRWYIIPRNRFFNVYLHKFCKSDDDRALHDHPWLFNASILLKGEYVEHLPCRSRVRRRAFHFSGFCFRWGKAPHRIQLMPDLYDFWDNRQSIFKERPVWTLFITGHRVREWGFYCPKGWRHWKDFTADNGKKIGRGCE